MNRRESEVSYYHELDLNLFIHPPRRFAILHLSTSV